MKRTRAIVLATATAAVLAVSGATATAALADPSPSATSTTATSTTGTSTTAPTHHHRGRVAALLIRDLLRHGGAIGKVTSVSDTSLTVTGAKGKAHTYDVASTTTVHLDHGRRDREVGHVSDVTVGERVVVRAARASGSGPRDAASIDVLLPPSAAPSPSSSTPGS